MENGYAVVACGATSLLGSVDTLETIMSKNIRETGDGKIEIDTDRRPVFKFGNGAKKECLSTAKVGMQLGRRNGSLEVHVHQCFCPGKLSGGLWEP